MKLDCKRIDNVRLYNVSFQAVKVTLGQAVKVTLGQAVHGSMGISCKISSNNKLQKFKLI